MQITREYRPIKISLDNNDELYCLVAALEMYTGLPIASTKTDSQHKLALELLADLELWK